MIGRQNIQNRHKTYKLIKSKMSKDNDDDECNGFTVKELKEQREIIQRAYLQKEISRKQYLNQLESIENEILVSSSWKQK